MMPERQPIEKLPQEVIGIELPNQGFRENAPSLLCPTCDQQMAYKPVPWKYARRAEDSVVIFQASIYAYRCEPCKSPAFYLTDVKTEINEALDTTLQSMGLRGLRSKNYSIPITKEDYRLLFGIPDPNQT